MATFAPGLRPDIDLVHDHLEVVGPSVLGALDRAAPPVLQTLHWDLRKHPEFYGSFDGKGRVLFNGVSDAQLRAWRKAFPKLDAFNEGMLQRDSVKSTMPPKG